MTNKRRVLARRKIGRDITLCESILTDEQLAEELKDAYSYVFYGKKNWRECVTMLRRRGHNDREIEAIMRSKWTRWADDGRIRDRGKATAADLAAFLDDPRNKCAAELPGLVRETFGEPEPPKPAPRPGSAGTWINGEAVLRLLRDIKALWDEAGLGEDPDRSEALYGRLERAISELEGTA